MIFEVSSQADLSTALKFASGGDTIKLKVGDYSDVKITNLQFDKPVVITSADAGHPATIDTLTLTNVTGVTLQNLAVKGDGTDLTVTGGKNITLDHLDVSGKSTDGPAGTGVMVRNSTNVNVTNSQFHNLGTGLSHLDSNHLNFSGNTFKDIRADGIHGGGSSYVTIANNSFSDFYRSAADHPDAIQFWTTNTKASAHDIVVKDNLIQRGDGNVMQGIFITDQSGGKLPYVNVTVTGNTVIGSMYNGIALGSVKDSTVSGNTVVGYTDMKAWIMVNGSSNTTISNNVTSQLSTGSDNVNVSRAGNTIVPLTTAATDDSYINSFLKAHVIGAADASDAASKATSAVGLGYSAASNATTSGTTVTAHLVVGDGGANDLKGTSGVDAMSGGSGADTMAGGAGDDLYFVDNTHDKVVEAAGQGTDTVLTTLGSYTLGSNVENLKLVGTATQTGTGNDLANVLTGNAVASNLNGGAGNDTLVGAGGADTMTGGVGHDTFRFDSIGSKADVVTDFVKGDDVVDLHTLLANYHGTNPVADGWVKFQVDGAGTTILVDTDGASGPNSFQSVVTLTGVKAALAAHTDWIF